MNSSIMIACNSVFYKDILRNGPLKFLPTDTLTNEHISPKRHDGESTNVGDLSTPKPSIKASSQSRCYEMPVPIVILFILGGGGEVSALKSQNFGRGNLTARVSEKLSSELLCFGQVRQEKVRQHSVIWS